MADREPIHLGEGQRASWLLPQAAGPFRAAMAARVATTRRARLALAAFVGGRLGGDHVTIAVKPRGPGAPARASAVAGPRGTAYLGIPTAALGIP